MARMAAWRAVAVLAALTSCNSDSGADDAPTPIPTLRWFENDQELFVRLLVKNADVAATSVTFTEESFSVSTFGEEGDTLRRQMGDVKPVAWKFSLQVREDIVPDKSKFVVKPTDIMLTMSKKHAHSFDRLSYLEAPAGFRGRIKMEQESYDKTNSSEYGKKGGATGRTWAAGDDDEDDDIRDDKAVQWLTDTSFDAFCAKHETVVADIFFPWCGKCKQEKKHFAKLAKKLAKNKQLKFAMIDAREHRLLARKFDVKCEDPCRLLVFKHDEPLTHIDAKLSSSALQTELKPYLGPLIKPLQPKQATVEFAKEHDSVAAIALLQKDSPAHIAFVALARSLRSSLVFGAVFADSDASFSTSAPALKVFNPANGKAGVGEFRGEWSDETLRAFIETEREPLLQEYSYDLRSKAEKKARAVGVLFVRRTESSKRKDRTAEQKKLDAAQNVHEATVRNVSAAHRGRMTFLWAAEAEFGHILEEFGLPRTTLPAFVVYHYGRILDHGRGASKYAYQLMHTDATTDTTVGGAAAAKLDVFVRSVLTDVKADRAPRAFKSESVPDQPAAQPSVVRKVVMASFAAEVESATHSVLLTVHTETNTKWKEMEPVLARLAAVLAQLVDLSGGVFFKEMDSVRNDKPDGYAYDMYGAPEYFFVAPGGKPMKFEGEADGLALLRFVHAHVSPPFDLALAEQRFADAGKAAAPPAEGIADASEPAVPPANPEL